MFKEPYAGGYGCPSFLSLDEMFRTRYPLLVGNELTIDMEVHTLI